MTPQTKKQLREELFSIMCAVVAEHSQPQKDYKDGKLTVYKVGAAEQKVLIKYRNKTEALFTTHLQTIKEAVEAEMPDELPVRWEDL